MAFDPNQYLKNLEKNPNRTPRMYLEVKWRLVWLRHDHPDWGIQTECLSFDDRRATFKCTITDSEGRVISVGHATETPNDFPDFYEKAETKSQGRALAAAGYGTQFAPELDEGDRLADSPVEMSEPEWDGTAVPTIGQMYALAKKGGLNLDALVKAKGKTVDTLSDEERVVVAKWMMERGQKHA